MLIIEISKQFQFYEKPQVQNHKSFAIRLFYEEQQKNL